KASTADAVVHVYGKLHARGRGPRAPRTAPMGARAPARNPPPGTVVLRRGARPASARVRRGDRARHRPCKAPVAEDAMKPAAETTPAAAIDPFEIGQITERLPAWELWEDGIEPDEEPPAEEAA